MSVLHILLFVMMVFGLLASIAVVFFERKNPASSLAWVMVLVFVPVVGFIAYLFLGTGYKINKRKKFAMKAIRDTLYGNFILKHLHIGDKPSGPTGESPYRRLRTYLKTQADGFYTDDNAAETFIDGVAMFDSLLSDIKRAKDHVHLLFYIFRDDELGRAIVGALTEKVREGVEVRIMYDSVGSMLSFDPIFKELKAAGGEVRAFSPIFSTLSSHLRLNYRNHRKIAVIDGRIGYVGGMNVGIEYMGRHPRLKPWRDTHLRFTGSAVWFLQERILMDWSYAVDTDPPQISLDRFFPAPLANGNLGVQVVASGPDTFESPLKSGLMAMLFSAKKSIYIQTPYFAPDQSFLDAIRIAAHSGLDVRLMIPAIADYDIVHRATLGYAREAVGFGINVFLYPGFLHAKTVTVDGQVASIGTTNITNRSFTLDFEVNAFVYDQAFTEAHEELFRKDQAISQRVDKAYFTNKSRITRASYNFARLFAPMM